jgi:hypothetical protein
LRTECAALVLALLAILAGCKTPGSKVEKAAGPANAARGERVFFTVDFEQGQTLRYRFVSSRDITLDWEPGAASGKDRVQAQSERLETVVAYTPLAVDPYGVSTVRAVCESVEVTRSGGPSGRSYGQDAVQSARGKTFVLKVDPRGKIVDYSQLEALIKEMGEKAFRPDTTRGRIKEPDMIADFVACQWFLWDGVSSVEQPAEGVAVGQRWESKLSVPTPMVIREARDVTYRLDEIREDDGGRLAVIKSSYALAPAAPANWPVPYSGRFQMSGTFGFLGAYAVSGLTGVGEELFHVDAGRVEARRQKYTMEMSASLPPIGIRANPHIKIEQTLTMALVKP